MAQGRPTDKLPVEILLKIMKLYVEDISETEPHPNHYGWLQITHVCRRWRDASLEDLSFWQNISLYNMDVADALVKRTLKGTGEEARQTSLSIEGRVLTGDLETRRKLDLIAGNAARISSLDLTASTDFFLRLGQQSGPHMAQLRELILEREVDNHAGGSNDDQLLDVFLGSPLTKLRLRNFAFPVFEPLLSSTIRNLALDGEYLEVTTQEVLMTVNKLPELRYLFINASFGRSMAAVAAVDPAATIKLLALEELRLSVNSVEDAKFLTSIDAPHLRFAEFDIDCSEEDSIEPVIQLITPLLPEPSARGLCRAARFEARNFDCLDLRFAKGLPDALTTSSQEEGVHIVWRSLSWPSSSKALHAMKVHFKYSLKAIEDLSIADGEYDYCAVSAWYMLFKLMNGVQTLHLEGRAIDTMRYGLGFDTQKGTYRILFPDLRKVTLDSIQFRPPQPQGGTPFIQDLLRSFQHRADAQSINNLTILHAVNLRQKDIDRLRATGAIGEVTRDEDNKGSSQSKRRRSDSEEHSPNTKRRKGNKEG
ncbi:hypothetical protein NEOLEDRAFT_989501 [Neolentinus lepideus HHB14362 ss-1]|uniref:F-box domain-containing protein n=1 Tax=Neolentinus lepideus HHB14362 ss-1 TaxID=1314782 RepID=A0A165N4F3_9AGAM|nr:hypothetical protein NEOLEDRAFT_989501 [Neolentinus lepideus HHB14362 ss-1]